jgi:hypothetical protein
MPSIIFDTKEQYQKWLVAWFHDFNIKSIAIMHSKTETEKVQATLNLADSLHEFHDALRDVDVSIFETEEQKMLHMIFLNDSINSFDNLE